MTEWGESDLGSRGVRGVGEADEGRVRVTAVDERLASARVDPRLLRSSPETLTPHLVEAVNAALADCRAVGQGSPEIPAFDPDEFDLNEVAGDLRKTNEQFELEMHRTATWAAETAAELRRSGVAVGVLPTLDFGDLVDDLTDVLRRVDGLNVGDEEVAGAGESARGLVRAVCGSGGRLDSLSLHPDAMRGTVELERNLVEAVNAALEELAEKVRERRVKTEAESRALRKELGELRERNLARCESYFRALTDVVHSIRPQ